MIAQNYQESAVKKIMWNNLNTKMFETYVSLGEDDIDAEVLERQGVRKKKQTAQQNPLAPVPCPHCHGINRPRATYCDACGAALTEEVAATIEAKEALAQRSDDYQKILEQLRKDLGIHTID
jgi:uncharacterized paraquat-inducible protein A